MAIRPLRFQKPVSERDLLLSSRKNWDAMAQGFDFKLNYPNLNSFTQGYAWGHYYLQGPLVYVYIWLYGTPTWASNAYIEFPVPPLRLPVGAPGIGNSFTQYIGQLIDATTGEPVNDEYHEVIIDPNNDKAARILFKTSGSVAEGVLSGTYIRS